MARRRRSKEMKKIICLSAIFFFNFSLFVVAKPAIAAVGVSCQSLTISPQKTAYAPGETINVEAKGTGAVRMVNVYYVKTNPDLTSTNPLFWRWNNVNGSYDPVSISWKGTIILPQQDGEYIITENISDANGQICSGNPAYTCPGCIKGTEAKTDASGNVIEVGKYSCQGCHKVVVVDSNYGRTTGYDLKKYWNMSPGYSWNYEGENNYSGAIEKFNTRFSIEEKVNACGHTALPWRFTKNNIYGYWMPNTPQANVLGDVNLRFLLTYFQGGELWSQNSIGALYSKAYHFPSSSTNPISEIGSIYPGYNVNFRTLDTQSYAYNYFAPYLYAPNLFVPANYDFERTDMIYGSANQDMCVTVYNPNHNHYWHIAYIPDSVDTPAYKGPALRVWQVEAGLSRSADGKWSTKPEEGFNWITREDWYLAENIGIVQVDEYGGWCKDNLSACLSKDKPYSPPSKPPVQFKLTSYYIGQPLQISVSPAQVEKNGTYTLHFNNNYTGYLEAKSCVAESSCTPGQPFKWGNGDGATYIWAENGVAEADLSRISPDYLPEGLYHNYFRPWIDTTPSDTPQETVITKTELPWSNEVLIRVGNPLPTPISLPGDLNGDGHVNQADYDLLVANFGNPYTIFDYNVLVGNWGETL